MTCCCRIWVTSLLLHPTSVKQATNTHSQPQFSLLPRLPVCPPQPWARSGKRDVSTVAFLWKRRGSAGGNSSPQLTLLAATGILAHHKAQDAVCSLKVSLFAFSQACPQPHIHACTHTHTHTHTCVHTNTHSALLIT